MCCATKRLTEIQCPSDCGYLAAARDHPAATVVRQQRRDVALVLQLTRDLSERQSQLFVLVAMCLVRQSADASARGDDGAIADLQPLIDADVADAMRALAATYETAVRGVIYDHRPASLPAQRLVAGLKPLLAEAGKSGGTAFERDAAVVLRRVEQAVDEARASDPSARRAFLEVLGRMFTRQPGGDSPEPASDTPRLIVP